MTALMVSPESRVRSVLLPRRPDLTRLNNFAGLVPPVVAREGDDRGNVGVGELLAERRHRGAPLAVQHDLHLSPPWAVDELGAVKRRERSLDPLPVRLMAGDAVRRVDLLAAGFQFGEIPFPVRIFCRGSDLPFLLADPGGVLLAERTSTTIGMNPWSLP